MSKLSSTKNVPYQALYWNIETSIFLLETDNRVFCTPFIFVTHGFSFAWSKDRVYNQVLVCNCTPSHTKIGIKCFSWFLLVAHGRKPSKPHFHGRIRWWISEEDRRNVWKLISTLPTFIKRNQDKKLLELSQIFLKMSTHHMFEYPDLDAGLNTSQFGGDIAFSTWQHRPRLAKPCLHHFKSGDKASW